MPTYEYACKRCGEHTEVVQSFTDPPLTRCPACKGAVRKVFGSVGITFKGSGFYKTDSRSTSSSDSSAKSDSGSAKGDGGSTKSDGGAAKSDAPTSAAAT